MNIAGLRSIGSAVLLVLLAGAGCNRPKRAWSESSAAPTPQGVRASITAHAPDAFYDSPPDLSRQPGALLRSEPLKDVILPAASNVNHGFVLDPQGSFSVFDVPGTGIGAGQGTIPLDNNNPGAITGEYIDGGNVTHGFLVEGL